MPVMTTISAPKTLEFVSKIENVFLPFAVHIYAQSWVLNSTTRCLPLATLERQARGLFHPFNH